MKPTMIYIYSNDTGLSKATRAELVKVLEARQIEVADTYDESVDCVHWRRRNVPELRS